MANTIAQLENKWTDDKSNLGEILKNTSQTLATQVTASEERAARAEAETRIEREWRMSLQEKEVKLKEQIISLQNCVKEIRGELQNQQKLQAELDKTKKQWSEAQETLEELGVQLSVSKLRVSELEDFQKAQRQLNASQASLNSSTDGNGGTSGNANSGIAAGIWAPDSIVTHCHACSTEFNVTRRKHHCRCCGDIFCNSCSSHKLPLLNEKGQSGKPVRVCDNCYSTKK